MDSVQFDRSLSTGNHAGDENTGYGPAMAGTGVDDYASRSSGAAALCYCGRSDRVSRPKFQLSQLGRIERPDGEPRFEGRGGCRPANTQRRTKRKTLRWRPRIEGHYGSTEAGAHPACT